MILDSNNYFLFTGGEVHCKLDTTKPFIKMRDYTMNGFMALAEHVEVTKRRSNAQIEVVYPYFPYARQDRVMNEDEPFSLKIFCDLVNNLQLDRITIYDPHSDVAPALINNCHVIPQWEIARKVIPQEYFDDPQVIFVSPDAGAYKKLSKLITDDQRIAIGVKHRDSLGNITGTKVFSPVNLFGATCVIVDDICDGGKTFIELAKALKVQGAIEIILYVTHGIFSRGLQPLTVDIAHIYMTDSIPQAETSFLTVHKL